MTLWKTNLIYLVTAIGVVLVWRGVWGLADIYLFPQNQVLSLIASVIIGVVLLLVINFKDKDIREIL